MPRCNTCDVTYPGPATGHRCLDEAKIFSLFDTKRKNTVRQTWDRLNATVQASWADKNWVNIAQNPKINALLLAAPNAVTDHELKALMTALILIQQHGANADSPLNLTLSAFKAKTTLQKLQAIDAIYATAVESVIPTVAAESMVEPLRKEAVVENQPHHTAIIRQPNGGFALRVDTPTNPWRTHTIGYRCEGKLTDAADLQRITTAGLQPIYANPPVTIAVKGHHIQGTIMGDMSTIKLFKGNRDVVGETGTCVARTLLGGTAFPDRKTQGLYWFWAVNCRGLMGIDTEQWQLSRTGTAVWRPGEKVFPGIPANRLIARCEINRLGLSDNGSDGWSFEFPISSKWHFMNATPTQKDWLNAELDAWKVGRRHSIDGTMDFA